MQLISMMICGFILDLLLGDPPSWPHPVKLMGHVISGLTHVFNQPSLSPRTRRWLGGLMWLIVVPGAYLSVIGIFWVVSLVPGLNLTAIAVLQFLIGGYLCYTCLSIKSLAQAADQIVGTLDQGDLATARSQVGMIVGRDTDQLNAAQVCKATIETVAENTSDGVIAPMVYMAIGGPALAIAYKAVNTLDSMVGYKNDRFGDIGKVSALIDDVVNFIPARITWGLLLISTFMLGYDSRSAIKVGLRDRENHRSPNSGFSESVVAGALDLRLGGPHYYFGELVDKPYIGTGGAHPESASTTEIKATVRLLYVSSLVGLLVIAGLSMIIYGE